MGAKNSFEWPLQDFKRFGQAKRVFSVELLDFNDVLNTREIIFRSKRAQVICDDFRGKLAALEQHVQPESPPMIEAVSWYLVPKFSWNRRTLSWGGGVCAQFNFSYQNIFLMGVREHAAESSLKSNDGNLP